MSRRRSATPAKPSLHSLLNQASRRMTSELRRVVEAEGVPVEFWRVLEVLADEAGRSMSELAAETGMQMPATSKVVDRMTEAALIQRSADPRDQRRVILHISDFGIQKFHALGAEMREHRNRLQSAFSPQQEERLRRLLADLIQAHQREAG
jgi:MarR family transcriptional regulator, organic hydroperoxide resistance regulator